MSHYSPDPSKSINLTIDGIPVTVPEGTRILEAAKIAGVSIPALCDCPELGKRSVCRLCVVHCDGRGKLIAACAHDVYEGAKVVTNSKSIQSIRKTILELILANHPQECLYCVRGGNCELQKLSAIFGIRELPFGSRTGERGQPITESETFVRDMDKCVKCGRCVEACQEVQTVRAINTAHRSIAYEISAPYDKPLTGGSCVFCGLCVELCPVGALYEHDQTQAIWQSLNDREGFCAAGADADIIPVLEKELELSPGSITQGKVSSAMRLLGFKKIHDAGFFRQLSLAEENRELLERINSKEQSQKQKLPMITGCSPAALKFVENFYPDLAGRLFAGKSPERAFAAVVRQEYAEETGQDSSKVTAVSVVPCLGKKYRGSPQGINSDNFAEAGMVITAREFARMIRLTGISIQHLGEEQFDMPKKNSSKTEAHDKVMVVNGFAKAREALDSVRKGECDASLIKILCCPECVIKGNR